MKPICHPVSRNVISHRATIAMLVLLTMLTISLTAISTSAQSAITVDVTLDDQVTDKPVSGRVLLFFSQKRDQPMFGPSWFGPEPFFAVDVVDMNPGSSVKFNDSSANIGQPLSALKDGKYKVQAILDHDFYFASHAGGPGNFYSQPLDIEIKEGAPVDAIKLTLDQVVAEKSYDESKAVKFFEIDSKLLGEFHKRQVLERALVVLPPSYDDQPDRRYPVYVEITGFGGTLERLTQRWSRGQPQPKEGETEFIRVLLTGQCKWGHHVYANSATNGPRGDMLVKEMLPAIDKQFRTIPESTARFVGGHSSGGWSSLWLQVAYPDFFGGVWSTAPDPVDFRDFQGANLYDDNASMFVQADGTKRTLARRGNTVMATYQDFTRMDDLLGRGGQIRSFDAVFSPLGEDGLPAYCWDRETGKVNPEVVEYWKRYDISLILQQNWNTLGPKLKSKLHVYMGDSDTFYLEGATIKLGERMKELGSDAVIEIFAGKDHGSLLTRELRSRIIREMSDQFWKHHPKE